VTNYEYAVITLNPIDSGEQAAALNNLGGVGWELVSVSLQTGSANHARVHAYLKRPLAKGKSK